MSWKVQFATLVFLSGMPLGYGQALRCENADADLGNVPEGKILTHDFVVKNVSGKPVRISNVFASCSCITSAKRGYVLQADETAEIPIEFNTAGYGGRDIRKEIHVFVDGQNQPELTLSVSAFVEGVPVDHRLAVEPLHVAMVNSSARTYCVFVVVPSDKGVQLDVTGPAWLDLRMKNMGEHELLRQTKWQVELQLMNEMKEPVRDYVILHSNLAGFEKVNIPVEVIPVHVVSVTPPVLFPKANENGVYRSSFELHLFEEEIKKLFGLQELQPVHVIASDSRIKVTKTPEGQGSNRYAVSIQEALGGETYLSVLLGDKTLGKVPVIFP